MNRREIVRLLGGAAVLWPVASRAQSMRRIGVLLGGVETDPDMQRRVLAFREGLQKFGWTEGRNVQIVYRWGVGDANRITAGAAELVAMTPDVILGGGNSVVSTLQRATPKIPIVFAQVSDPVALGFVSNLARPQGNMTGFSNFEQTIGVKWLELLKEIAPSVTRVALVYDPANPSWAGYMRDLTAASATFGVQVSGAPVHDVASIESALDALAREPNGGLIAIASAAANNHRDRIIALAARHRLPAIYQFRYFVDEGGLASYGVDAIDQYRNAASYVDRILKGEKVADLPVQQATKYELVINLKTTQALGLNVPPTLLARADEVVE